MTGLGRRWTLRRRVTALCVVVGAVLAMLAAGEAVVAAENRRHLNTLLTKTGPLRTDAQALLSALVDQQAGVRGYAVSGDEADLAPYRTALDRERALLASMDALLDDQPRIRRQLQTVRAGAEQWRAAVAEPVIAATAAGGPTAGVTLRIGLGIGRLVFRALNTAEAVLAVALVAALAVAGPPVRAAVLAGIAVTTLVLQLAVVRPALTRRSDRILAGADAPRSGGHYAYVALEAVKAIALIIAGSLLLTA